MIVFYTMGGGLGHLTRVKTFVENRGLPSPFKVITAHRAATQFFGPDELVQVPIMCTAHAADLREFLRQQLLELSPKAVYIDAFPFGVLGELEASLFHGMSVHYLARRLKWRPYEAYCSPTDPMEFEQTYLFELLSPSHQEYVTQSSKKLESIKLDYSWMSRQELGESSQLRQVRRGGRPIWLVVHTSRSEEVEVLIQQAQDISVIERREAQIVVLTDLELSVAEGVRVFRNEIARQWFPFADRIFTAAGFNTYYQLEAYRSIHEVIPFPRRWDDQFWRVTQK